MGSGLCAYIIMQFGRAFLVVDFNACMLVYQCYIYIFLIIIT
jgi:hypothetical protein